MTTDNQKTQVPSENEKPSAPPPPSPPPMPRMVYDSAPDDLPAEHKHKT